ncbi:MAG: hypothetical protein JXR94_21250 [Candidatus Hydrogenedentes bacterium]|nr:hypothetical protein [Candidatus Hydrogenedentota bacterium]
MPRVLSLISEAMESEHCRVLPCERVNLDAERFGEYLDSEEHPAERPFENPHTDSWKRNVALPRNPIPPILRYFLDGSRRTYKVADVVVGGRYLPLIAGQVGVAVIERYSERSLRPLRQFCQCSNLLAFPGTIEAADITRLSEVLSEASVHSFKLVQYSYKKDRDPVDLGVARIMSEMHDLEIQCVRMMAEDRLLATDRMLVIDGPLRFRKRLDMVQFRNVIGLSKTFRPSFSLGSGRRKKDVGVLAASLRCGERTTVFRTEEGEKLIGMWYLRIRPRRYMSNPLQGIVKAECYAVDHAETENGLDSARIDSISAHVYRERNVTPYKSDSRWASHVYPVFLAESFLKASFMSDVRFKALLT